jgi:hypothetical protein
MPVHWWIAAAALWAYFRWTTLRFKGADEPASLPKRPITFGNVLRASLVIAPGLAIERGHDLNTNLLLVSAALSVLISPLQIPTSEPDAEEFRVSAWRYATLWSLAEADRWLKTLGFGALIWGIQHLVVKICCPHWNEVEWMRVHWALATRPHTGLELPLAFYLTAVLILALRCMVLLAVPGPMLWRLIRPIFLWGIGILALAYFYNVAGYVHLRPNDWEAPGLGLLAATAWKLFISMHLAYADLHDTEA